CRDPRRSAMPSKAHPSQSPCVRVRKRRSAMVIDKTASIAHPITKYGNLRSRIAMDDSMILLTCSLQEQRNISSSAVDILSRLQQNRQGFRNNIGGQFVSSQQPQRINPVE